VERDHNIDRQRRRQVLQRRADRPRRRALILLAVAGDQDRAPPVTGSGRLRRRRSPASIEKGVDAGIASDMDCTFDAPVGPQIGRRRFGGSEQQARHGVDRDAVSLFRPGLAKIVGAQASLDMADGDAAIARRECAGQGSSGVAMNQHQIRKRPAELTAQGGVEAFTKLARRSAARVVRHLPGQIGGNPVEHCGQPGMLAGQDNPLVETAARNRTGQRRHLDRLRTSADDRDDQPPAARAPPAFQSHPAHCADHCRKSFAVKPLAKFAAASVA